MQQQISNEKLQPHQPSPALLRSNKLMTATVLSLDPESAGLLLKTPLGTQHASLAFSCHTQPEVGDTVLLADSDAGCYVTDILVRPTATPARQFYPSGTELISPKKMTMESHEEVAIRSSGKTSLVTADLSIAALKSRIRVLDIVAQITEFKGRFSKLSWVSDWAEQKANLLRQRFVRSDRKVEQQDMQQAGSLVQRVDKTASLRAEHTIIKARKDVQVDGKRIHMG